MASNGAASAAEVVIELSSSSDGSASRRATAAKTPRRRPNRQRVAPDNNSANKSMSPSTKKRTIDETKKEKKKAMKNGDAEVIKSKEMKKKKMGESKMGINNASSSPSAPTTLAIDGNVSCSFPMTRVWRLIRSEGGATTRTTNDAVFLINKASEMFLDVFAEDAFVNSTRERKMSISYTNLSSAVCNAKRYEFLSDFVPEQVRAEDAMKATTALAET